MVAPRFITAADSYLVSLKDFLGAKVDGVTDDSASVSSANSSGKRVGIPEGVANAPSVAANTLRGPFLGPGRIRDLDGNLRAPFFSAVASAPTSNGGESVSTAFNGDLSKCQFAVEHRITGSSTLGTPSTGYSYIDEAYPHFTYLYNASGYNAATDKQDGRTGAVAYRTSVYQAGQGDAVAYNVTGYVTGTRSGSTDVYANPAVCGFNGDFKSGSDGVYLNAGELSLDDAGFDVAGCGWVTNLVRSVATGAKNAFWSGFRAQSKGSASANNAFWASGKFDVGLDFSALTTSIGRAAIALKAGDRIYGDASCTNTKYATALGAAYSYFDSTVGQWLNFVNGKLKGTYILSASGLAASITGSTTETALATVPIPAGLMGTDGILRITSQWTYTNSANTKTIRNRLGGLGGTAFLGRALTTTGAIRVQQEIHNRGAANSQVAWSSGSAPWDTTNGSAALGSIDTSVAQQMILSAQLATSSETITLESYIVELIMP